MEENQEQILARQDITDEMRIQFAIDELYEYMKSLDNDEPDKIIKIVLMRNNLLNMTDTYLKKFNNKAIMKDYYNRLKKAKSNAQNNGRVNEYQWVMNEIRVAQEVKGMQDDIAKKQAKQFYENMKGRG